MEVNYFTIWYWFCHTSTWICHRYTEGGMTWENGIKTCIISYMKWITSPGSIHDTGCLGLVHWVNNTLNTQNWERGQSKYILMLFFLIQVIYQPITNKNNSKNIHKINLCYILKKEKRATEDKMVGWHHWFKGHELGQTPGDGEGQGSLACCSP